MYSNVTISHKYLVYIGVATAFVLRIFNLNYEGLWNDELFTAFSASPSASLGWTINYVGNDVHPPLHNILLKYWAENFSYNDTSLRMMNVVLGTIGVLSVYHVAKSLLNKKVAIIALWLAVVNSFLIEYSQEVRSYILLFLLANYSYYFLIKILKNTPKKGYIIAYILITAAALYTHYFALYLIASQGVALLFTQSVSQIKQYWKQYFILFVGPILLFIPWIPYFLRHAQQPFVWITKAEIGMIFSYPQAFFNDLVLGTLTTMLLLLLMLFFVVRKIVRIKPLERLLGLQSKEIIILLVWTSVYFGIPFIRSFVSTSNMNDRYFIAMVAPLLIILAFLITLLRKNSSIILTTTVVVCYSFLTIFLRPQPYYDQKAMYRDIVEKTTNIQGTTPILYLTARHRNFDYYLRQNRFWQLRRSVGDFDKYMNENSPIEYVVFIDLHHKIYKLDEILKENKLQYPGYELYQKEEMVNMNNIKTVQKLHYKKIKED